MSTLFEQNRTIDDLNKRSIVLTYHPALNEKLKKVFGKVGFKTINKPHQKLAALLGSTKDKVDKKRLSGVYLVQCKECEWTNEEINE